MSVLRFGVLGRLFTALVLALTLSCGGGTTEVVLVIDTDFNVPAEIDQLVISVLGSTGNLVTERPYFANVTPATLPLVVVLYPLGADDGPFGVQVDGVRDGQVVAGAGAELVASFVPGERRQLYVVLSRECLDKSCAQAERCDPLSGGLCVDGVVPPSQMTPWTGSTPEKLDVNCPGTFEECNGFDDDCDDKADETFDLESDELNCGSCGNECDADVPCYKGECGVGKIKEISAGGKHVCALGESGVVLCWGDNEHGQLGVGQDTPQIAQPVLVPGLQDVLRIDAGMEHTCAVVQTTDDEDDSVLTDLYCWGNNKDGQVGVDPMEAVDVRRPRKVEGGSQVETVSAGGKHTCALFNRNVREVRCWGSNAHDQLGRDGGELWEPELAQGWDPLPTEVHAPRGVSAGFDHTCAFAGRDNAVYCWGKNDVGQLGHGAAGPNVPNPTFVPLSLTQAKSIHAGLQHACGLRATGEVWCWGQNGQKQIGEKCGIGGADPECLRPERVLGNLVDSTVLSVGPLHSCVVRDPERLGQVSCWGGGAGGQLGHGSRDNSAAVVQPDFAGSPGAENAGSIQHVSAGGLRSNASGFTCAVSVAGEVYCWGNNEHGQMGAGISSETPYTRPSKVDLDAF